MSTNAIQQTSLATVAHPSNQDSKQEKPARNRVRFSSNAKGRFIRYPTAQENKAKWYNEEDYDRFEQRVARDALVCSNLLARIKSGRLNKMEFDSEALALECIGLDHLVSDDVQKSYLALKDRRKRHACIVLEEQEEQINSGSYCWDVVATVAGANSEPSRNRAHWVGKLVESMG